MKYSFSYRRRCQQWWIDCAILARKKLKGIIGTPALRGIYFLPEEMFYFLKKILAEVIFCLFINPYCVFVKSLMLC